MKTIAEFTGFTLLMFLLIVGAAVMSGPGVDNEASYEEARYGNQ